MNEDRIYEYKKNTKNPLDDIGIRFDRKSANILADGWRELGLRCRVYPRRIKVDGISYPVFMVVARRKS